MKAGEGFCYYGIVDCRLNRKNISIGVSFAANFE